MIPSDPAAPLGYVRLIVGDDAFSPEQQMFSDQEIEALLTREGGPLRAAARALDIIADSESRLSKKIRTQDLSTDGPAVAADLRRHAASLRAEADRTGEGEDGSDFAIVGFRARPTAPELANFRRFGDGWLS